MIFLSILANNAIAVPLPSGFPIGELRYIIENSEAIALLSTEKFREKAKEALGYDPENRPILAVTEKLQSGADSRQNITLDGVHNGKGGLMLYTSGTTSRPVWTFPMEIEK